MQENFLLTPNKIIRVKRRAIALIINNKGEFIVRAPLQALDSEIQAFINEKRNWIILKRKQMLESLNRNQLILKNGEYIHILGQQYEIILKNAKTAKIKDNFLILPLYNTEGALRSLLKKVIKFHLNFRVAAISKLYHFNYKSIRISSAKTNWGSCGSRNTLNFTYKLAMCPLTVVDYIIIHELCHTKVKNHSSKFWGEVKKICPDYKIHEKWLKQNRTIIDMI